VTKIRNAGREQRRIRAALFDLDDTLFDHQHCARASLEAVRNRHECFRCLPLEEVARAHAALLEELHVEVLAGRLDIDGARLQRFRRLFLSAGVTASDTLVRDAAAGYRQAYLAARRTVAGAAVLLQRVRAEAAVVVVSNNILDEQQNKLQHCGLDNLVDILVVSAEEGISKPDPAIFLRAVARAGCTPDAAVMVGDSWSADVAGARAAGVRAVWFNRHGLPRPERADDVAELRSFEPVEDAVRTIFGGATDMLEAHADRR
jgi:HAD superfamily hydrolase (TIGR01549 family)